MNILLLGCTGFFGKGIIYYLLNNTEYNLVLALRPKNKVSINERINKILDELHLKYTDKRIKLIKVEYDNLRNIIISKKDKEFLKKNIDIVLNGLADIKFNRVLKKAVLNNTITALNWMSFFQDCIRTKKYIYVSTAFVNFHLKNTGQISEIIYEQNMTDNTLTEILNGKITSIKPYNNTYLYSKQLTEILLLNRKNHISLSIFRPSVITPAVTYPYSGWANIQTFSFQMFAIGTGILPCWNVSMKHIFNNNINIIPVDIAAKDCILMIDDKKDFNIKHSCLTGNNKYSLSFFDIYSIYGKTYNYYKHNPICINNKIYKPYNPFLLGDQSYVNIILLWLQYLLNRFLNRINIYSFFKELFISYKITTEFSKYISFFVSKQIVFHRKSTDKWFYQNFNQFLSWDNFAKNINTNIQNDEKFNHF